VIVATILSGNSESIVADAVQSALGWVDLYLLIDTGITDGTVQTVRQIVGDKLRVESLPWRNDFAGARNFAIQRASALGGAWALTLDTDERLEFTGFKAVQDLHQKLNSDPGVLTWMVPDRERSYAKERFIRLPTNLRWQGRTHEALIGASPIQRATMHEATFSEVPKSPAQFQRKLERDLEILDEETKSQPKKCALVVLSRADL